MSCLNEPSAYSLGAGIKLFNTIIRISLFYGYPQSFLKYYLCEILNLNYLTCIPKSCSCNGLEYAAAKSLQWCRTLCDPIDGSPQGSPVPGILQARTLEWVAISFSNA